MQEEFNIVDSINAKWDTVPKNTLLKSDLPGGKVKFWFTWESGQLRLVLMTIVGSRKGLSEQIYLIDNSQSVFIDRLRLADVTTDGNGVLLPLVEMRKKVRIDKQDPYKVAGQYMRSKLADLLEHPEWHIKFLLERNGPQSESVVAIQGGAPGLGKRH